MKAATRALVNVLKRGRRVHYEKQNVFVLLRRDGTVISFHERTVPDFFGSVAWRLSKRTSLLRSKPDPSLLVHALLDQGQFLPFDLVTQD